MQTKKVEVTQYAGTNEVINRLMDEETVWIVQGPAGRRPIIAVSREVALEEYEQFYTERFERDCE